MIIDTRIFKMLYSKAWITLPSLKETTGEKSLTTLKNFIVKTAMKIIKELFISVKLLDGASARIVE